MVVYLCSRNFPEESNPNWKSRPVLCRYSNSILFPHQPYIFFIYLGMSCIDYRIQTEVCITQMNVQQLDFMF